MKYGRLGAAAVVMGLLAGSVGSAVAQDTGAPTGYESWRTKELEPGILRILDDRAGHDLTRKWPRNHRGLDHIAVGPEGDVWIGVNVPIPDEEQRIGFRLWPLGREKTYGARDGLGRHNGTLAFDDQGRLWLFGSRIATFDDGEWSSTRAANEVIATDGSIWLGGGMGVEQWDGTELVPHLEGVWTGRVFLGPDDTVGVEAWDGTRLFDGTDWHLISRRPSERAVTADGVLAVRDGDGKGVRLFRGDQATTALDDARVNSLAAAPDGSIWIAGSVGRNRAAVYRIDPAAVFAAQETAADADETEKTESAEDASST